jgi:ketosteroid isomerase-like protein
MKIATLVSTMFAFAICSYAPLAVADDEDDVRATIQRWADLEGDLQAQTALIRDDRVTVTQGGRQDNQADNYRFQKAVADARNALAGGPAEVLVSIRGLQVAVYGSTAVASFVRQMRIIPHNAEPLPTGLLWFSLVLVKERGDWGIAHMHVGPAGPN